MLLKPGCNDDPEAGFSDRARQRKSMGTKIPVLGYNEENDRKRGGRKGRNHGSEADSSIQTQPAPAARAFCNVYTLNPGVQVLGTHGMNNRRQTSTASSLRLTAERVGFSLSDVLPSALLAALAAAFEALSLVLLLPATRASIGMNLALVRDSFFIHGLFSVVPSARAWSETALFLLLLGTILATVLLKLTLSYLAAATFAKRCHSISARLRQILFEQALRCRKLYFDQVNYGHLQSVVANSADRIATNVISLQELLAGLFLLITYLLIMVAISWRLTLAFIVILPMIHHSSGWLSTRIRESSRALTKAREALNSRLSNVLSCILLIKSFTSEEWERHRFSALNAAVERHQADMDAKAALVRPIQETVFLLFLVAFLSTLAFVDDGKRSSWVPGLLVFVYLARRASISMMLLGRYQMIAATLEGSLSEALRLLETSDKQQIPDGTGTLTALREGILLQELDFTFPNGARVLRGVTFAARKGEMTAIVGPSGAGKTTLFNLLQRFYDPPPGTILLDGEDIRRFSERSLRSRMALVNQEPLLFNDSIRNNLAYAMEPIPEDAVLFAALERAHLLDFVRHQPAGLDTVVGDKGIALSGGERQRLSIARAMLRNAEILFLDEATSSLDSETEALVRQSIESLLIGKTSLVITHRLSTIKHAHKIVVLDSGIVTEEGDLADLLSRNGPFRRHWEAQGFR